MTINQRIAVFVTKTTGTMWAAYAFLGLSLISLPAAIASRDPIVIISWLSQSFLQLVLLPIIMVGQTVQTGHHEKAHKTRQEHTHKLDAILKELKSRQ